MMRMPFAEPPAEGEAIEVADGVLWMRLPLPMALDHVNVYALRDQDGWTIVDTGFYSKRGVRIWEKLLNGPLAGAPVTRVLVTHHHPDHVGMAGWFQSEHAATLYMSRTAWILARMLWLDEQERPNPETIAHWRRAGMDADVLAKRIEERPFNFADCVYPMPLGYEQLKQGDVFRAAGRRWDIHLGGGHAPDHITLWSQEDDLVITGDQVIPSISSNIGVYATEPFADPLADWLESCERLAGLAQARHFALPGHKLPFYGLPERLRQLIENHHSALDRLMTALGTPQAAGDVLEVLFKRRLKEGEYGLGLVEAIAHMNHLAATGRAIAHDDPDGVRRFVAGSENCAN